MTTETRGHVTGMTDPGMVRKNNEDSFIAQPIWDDRHILCAAIDGIGGYEGGEIAAAIARDSIIKYLEDFHSDDCLDMLNQAVTEANNEIVRHRQAEPRYSQMGCVATVGLIDLDDNLIYVAHIGDSRLYRIAEGQICKLSHDHSLVGYREEIGELTEEEAMTHPQRNIIERSLGERQHMLGDPHFIDSAIFPITSDSTFLFCSDGLSDMIRSEEIRHVLENDSSTEEKAKTLIDLANRAGGKDNITVVVAEVNRPTENIHECNDDGSRYDTDSPDEQISDFPDDKFSKLSLIILITAATCTSLLITAAIICLITLS